MYHEGTIIKTFCNNPVREENLKYIYICGVYLVSHTYPETTQCCESTILKSEKMNLKWKMKVEEMVA